MVQLMLARARELRKDILTMIHAAGSGHPGGSLSVIDILNVLYFHEMKLDPKNPTWEHRDFCILSKGHGCPALYAVLAKKGFFPTSWLGRLRQIGGELQGHPDRKKTPGIEFNSGSLSQGFSFAAGTALGSKHMGVDNRSYVILGCGELDEGQVWEAAMFAAHHKLDNLVAIIDYNKLQSDDHNDRIMKLEPLRAKWDAFNWNVIEVDGHNYAQLIDAFSQARKMKLRPTVLIAHTVKGKGVSFMEQVPRWHGSLAPSDQELKQALAEIEESP